MSVEVASLRLTQFSMGRVIKDSLGIFGRSFVRLLAIACLMRLVVTLAPPPASDEGNALSWTGLLLEDLTEALASGLNDAALILGVMLTLRGQRGSITDVVTGLRYAVPATIATAVCHLPSTIHCIERG
jgi:hypothetical protein